MIPKARLRSAVNFVACARREQIEYGASSPRESSFKCRKGALSQDHRADLPIRSTGKGVQGGLVATGVQLEDLSEIRVHSAAIKVSRGIPRDAIEIKIVKGVGSGLDEQAIEAVKNWRFQPRWMPMA